MIATGVVFVVLQILAVGSSFLSGKNPFERGVADGLGYFLIGIIGVILIIVGYRRKSAKNDSTITKNIQETTDNNEKFDDEIYYLNQGQNNVEKCDSNQEQYKVEICDFNQETVEDELERKEKFLVPNEEVKIKKGEIKKMDKRNAIELFYNQGNVIHRNCTFASKNRTTDCYWANPNFRLLQGNWSLILNDDINNVLYLFNIPANSISSGRLVARSDLHHLIDLQINYRDPSFTDRRSDFSFSKFLVAEIKYNEDLLF